MVNVCIFKNEHQTPGFNQRKLYSSELCDVLVQKVLKSVTLELKGKYSALRTLGRATNTFIFSQLSQPLGFSN